MTKTKVLDLEKLYNFVVDNFSFEIIYPIKITFEFLTFEIQDFSNGLGWRNDQTKVVNLDDIYNLAVEKLFLFKFI